MVPVELWGSGIPNLPVVSAEGDRARRDSDLHGVLKMPAAGAALIADPGKKQADANFRLSLVRKPLFQNVIEHLSKIGLKTISGPEAIWRVHHFKGRTVIRDLRPNFNFAI
jgi:hypothetical protein